MFTLPLGQSGTRVSAIGLGCVGMANAYGPADERESISTMSAALDEGIDFFDTADLYGAGANEELIGKFLRHAGRHRVRVATKFGSLPPGADGLPGVDNSPGHIRSACEASLRRLGVDQIDLYYMHRRDPKVPIADAVGAMSRLVEEGKVALIGLSEVNANTLRDAHATHPIAALQSEYSLWFREPEKEILPTCEALGITFVPFSPLGRGFLSGTVATDSFSPGDLRNSLPRFRGDALARNRTLVQQLSQLAGSLGATPAQVALSWLLSRNTESLSIVPIPGTKRVEFVRQNAKSAKLTLTESALRQLDNLFRSESVFGDRYNAVETSRAGL